jgi:hypothetical protein
MACSERKLRLYACACAEPAAGQSRARAHFASVLLAAERLAEGVSRSDEVRLAGEQALSLEVASPRNQASLAGAVSCTLEREAYRGACGTVADLLRYEREVSSEVDAGFYSDLLRCVFGNPYRGLNVGFRPVKLDPRWLTSTVAQLATGVYADRAFDRLPILADALQDAGCDDDHVLTHLRGPGPHARGCWVVDLVLGKS